MNIDREIAERLMGYVKKQGGPYYITLSSGMKEISCHGSKDVDAVLSWWHPSTDIKQAFEVVEKMREWGFEFMIQGQTERYVAMFGKGTCWGKENGIGDTPAMAICLAALKAVEA